MPYSSPEKRKEYDREYHKNYRRPHRRTQKWRDWYRKYYAENAERILVQGKESNRLAREEAIGAYGGYCACCGEDTFEFLEVDHMVWPKKPKVSGSTLYQWLRRNKYPKGFQILCSNCNMSLGRYGYCPHRPEIRREVHRTKGRPRTVSDPA